MNPFDFLNAINHTKEDIMVDDIVEKQYSQKEKAFLQVDETRNFQ